MVIAIMGDTFDKVMDERDRYSKYYDLGICPEIYEEYFDSLKFKDDFYKKIYLYVVTFDDEEENYSEWQSQITTIK